jgi:hypothetical protein
LRNGAQIKTFSIVESPAKRGIDVDSLLLAYWLLYCRAPGNKTLPGEAVDLGEIGQVKKKDWERLTPYSPAEPLR